MDISASASVAAHKPSFESLEGAVRRMTAAEAQAQPRDVAEATPPRFLRKGQALDIRV